MAPSPSLPPRLGAKVAQLLQPNLSGSLQTFPSLSSLLSTQSLLIISGLLSSPSPFLISRLLSSAALLSFPYSLSLLHSLPHHLLSLPLFNSLIFSISRSPALILSAHFFKHLLRSGLSPNHLTFPLLLRSSSPLPSLSQSLHSHLIRLGLHSDIFIVNTTITMYSHHHDLLSARKVFDQHSPIAADPITWTAIITAYSDAGDLHNARRHFDQCPIKNAVTWNAMVTGYARAGRAKEARDVFDEMPHRNAASWGSLLSGFVKSRLYREAVVVFKEMVGAGGGGVMPNEAVLVSVVSACAQSRALEEGEWVYEYVRRSRVRMGMILATAFVDMFGKCGDIASAIKVFDEMPEKNVYSWNSLIKGLANNGCGRQALTLFWKMKLVGVTPNDVTFIGLLSACSHTRLVDEGRRFFDTMTSVYDIRPSEEHYGCVADLLARAGLIKAAIEFMDGMPVEPHTGLLGALVGGCRIHGDVEVGEEMAKRLIEMEPERAGRYVMLANIYAAARRWDDVETVRRMLKERRVGKVAGNSSVCLQSE